MSNVTHLPAVMQQPAVPAFRPNELALIKRTVAADTNDDEFNLFIAYCRALTLDPRRRQIYAFVYNKGDAAKRKMSIVVSIDGLRTIAARSGCYRPDEDEPRFEIDPALKGPNNPAGLVKAVVKVWHFSHGSWHPVTAAAYWEEYAPMKEEAEGGFTWEDTGEIWPDSGKPKKRKVAQGEVRRVLDTSGKWAQMPRVMLAKVAEALALRKAWPDDFSGLHAEEEMARAQADDVLPAEAVLIGATEDRLAKIGAGRTILIDWLDNRPIEPVPVGQLADRIMAFIDANADAVSQIGLFRERNRYALREFWAAQPTDALEIKRQIEARLAAEDGAA